MSVEVRTERYEFTHGHAPRGRGYWAFDNGQGARFIQGERTYGDAKKIAVAEAGRMGDATLEVCP